MPRTGIDPRQNVKPEREGPRPDLIRRITAALEAIADVGHCGESTSDRIDRERRADAGFKRAPDLLREARAMLTRNPADAMATFGVPDGPELAAMRDYADEPVPSDAARYRFLRDRESAASPGIAVPGRHAGDPPTFVIGATADRAVGAAMNGPPADDAPPEGPLEAALDLVGTYLTAAGWGFRRSGAAGQTVALIPTEAPRVGSKRLNLVPIVAAALRAKP